MTPGERPGFLADGKFLGDDEQRLRVVATGVAGGGNGDGVRADDLGDRPCHRDLLAHVGLHVVQDIAGGRATTSAAIATTEDAALTPVGQVRADGSGELDRTKACR